MVGHSRPGHLDVIRRLDVRDARQRALGYDLSVVILPK